MRFGQGVVGFDFGDFHERAYVDRTQVRRALRRLDSEVVAPGRHALVRAELYQDAMQRVDIFDRGPGESLGADDRLVRELDDVGDLSLQPGMAELDRARIREVGAFDGERDRVSPLDAGGGNRRDRRRTDLRHRRQNQGRRDQ